MVQSKSYDFSKLGRFGSSIEGNLLPSNYDEKLFDEIRLRTQGETENIAVYFAVMKSLFTRVAVPLRELQKLAILKRNVAPYFQHYFPMYDEDSIEGLETYCRHLECSKAALDQFTPPPRRFSMTEPELSYLENQRKPVVAMTTPVKEKERPTVVSKTAKRITCCWNCNKEGHSWRFCKTVRKRFCYC